MESISFIDLSCATLAIVCMYIGAQVVGRWITRKVLSLFSRNRKDNKKSSAIKRVEMDVVYDVSRVVFEFADGTETLDLSAPKGETLIISSYENARVITLSNGIVLALTTSPVCAQKITRA